MIAALLRSMDLEGPTYTFKPAKGHVSALTDGSICF